MMVAIHQPNYFPWLGFFHKLLHCDVFVLLDHVQYSVGSYTSRVQLLGPQGPQWLTIPVLKSGRAGQAISELRSNDRMPWRGKHLKTLRTLYGRHPAFEQVFPMVEALLETDGDGVADGNCRTITALAGALGARCRILRSSELPVPDLQSNALLVWLVRSVGGDAYLHGSGAESYHDAETFAGAGVQLVPQSFRHPRYQQLKSEEFVSGLSVLDCLFNVGVNGCRDLLADPADPASSTGPLVEAE